MVLFKIFRDSSVKLFCLTVRYASTEGNVALHWPCVTVTDSVMYSPVHSVA